jgi:hypothetical protein
MLQKVQGMTQYVHGESLGWNKIEKQEQARPKFEGKAKGYPFAGY